AALLQTYRRRAHDRADPIARLVPPTGRNPGRIGQPPCPFCANLPGKGSWSGAGARFFGEIIGLFRGRDRVRTTRRPAQWRTVYWDAEIRCGGGVAVSRIATNIIHGSGTSSDDSTTGYVSTTRSPAHDAI